MPLKTLTLIRHGDNIRDWDLGDAVGLSDIGVKQINLSIELLLELANLSGSCLVISDKINRAVQTASVIEQTLPPSLNVHRTTAPHLNGDTVHDWLSFYIGVFWEDYKETLWPDNPDPDHIIAVTHAHNPLSQLMNIWLDSSSATLGQSPFVGKSSEEILDALRQDVETDTFKRYLKPLMRAGKQLDSSARRLIGLPPRAIDLNHHQADIMPLVDKNGPYNLRKAYGGVAHYEIIDPTPVSPRSFYNKGKRTLAFSPWISGYIPK